MPGATLVQSLMERMLTLGQCQDISCYKMSIKATNEGNMVIFLIDCCYFDAKPSQMEKQKAAFLIPM